MVYTSFRNTETDLPVLTMAVADPGGLAVCRGRPARPGGAGQSRHGGRAPEAVLALRYGTNTRASGEYRSHLAGVLLGRCLKNLKGGKHA